MSRLVGGLIAWFRTVSLSKTPPQDRRLSPSDFEAEWEKEPLTPESACEKLNQLGTLLIASNGEIPASAESNLVAIQLSSYFRSRTQLSTTRSILEGMGSMLLSLMPWTAKKTVLRSKLWIDPEPAMVKQKSLSDWGQQLVDFGPGLFDASLLATSELEAMRLKLSTKVIGLENAGSYISEPIAPNEVLESLSTNMDSAIQPKYGLRRAALILIACLGLVLAVVSFLNITVATGGSGVAEFGAPPLLFALIGLALISMSCSGHVRYRIEHRLNAYSLATGRTFAHATLALATLGTILVGFIRVADNNGFYTVGGLGFLTVMLGASVGSTQLVNLAEVRVHEIT